MSIVPVKGQDIQGAEVAWFAPLCSDDFRHLGVPESDLKSNWANTSRIVERADELGFRNILCPSSYQVGQDTLTFAAAVAQEAGQFCVQVFFFRAFQNWGNRAYYPKADRSHEAPEIMASFLAQFYDDKDPPRLILLSHPVENEDLVAAHQGCH